VKELPENQDNHLLYIWRGQEAHRYLGIRLAAGVYQRLSAQKVFFMCAPLCLPIFVQGHTGAPALPPRPIPPVGPSVGSADEDTEGGAGAGGRKLTRAERIAEQQAARNQRLGKRGAGSREDEAVDPMDPVSERPAG
jgi:hypothetical protein